MTISCPHPALSAALQKISDELESDEILHVITPTDENPLAYICGAFDHDGFLNSGFISAKSDNSDELVFAAYDSAHANHNAMEGVPESESRHWWKPDCVETFILFLSGEVRGIQRGVVNE